MGAGPKSHSEGCVLQALWVFGEKQLRGAAAPGVQRTGLAAYMHYSMTHKEILTPLSLVTFLFP